MVNYKGNPHFIRAIEKYGWENFSHEILEDNIPTIEKAGEREQYYIILYNSLNSMFGYNILKGGASPLSPNALTGLKQWQENNPEWWKNQIEGMKRWREANPEKARENFIQGRLLGQKARRRKVYCYENDTVYESASEASRKNPGAL